MIVMTILKVRSSKLRGGIEAPPSKSYTHRATAIALLANGESEIDKPLTSLDTRATLDASRILGARISVFEKTWKISGTGGELKPKAKTIDVRNSGTTLRFMSAIASLSPTPIRLTGDQSLLRRPMGPLIDALRELGAQAECEGKMGRPPVVVGGGIQGGEVEITGGTSSQFISALLIACPRARDDVKITIVDELRSKPYVEMTLHLLSEAGIKIRKNRKLTEFRIPSEQEFKPLSLTIPGDFSSASFILGAAAVTGSEVSVGNLDSHYPQGDMLIIPILREFGVDVEFSGRTVMVLGSEELEGTEIDCGDVPDLVPILAVLGTVAEGRTTLANIPHLRFKETDRIHALASELRKMGAEVRELEDELRIRGTRKLKGTYVNSYGDHRMAMALTVAGLVAEGTTVVGGAESIPVSYPQFVEDMLTLGARIEVKP